MRRLFISASVAVLLILVWFGWKEHRNYRLNSEFEKVSIGTSKFEVARSLGKPDKIEPCNESFGGPPATNCAEEFLYGNSFAPIVPEYWSVSFDKSGRVIAKNIYSSP
jgi:hypothetical protein